MRASHPSRRHPPSFHAADFPVTLHFGAHPATLRFLRPHDEDRLLEFFASHTPETIRDRYGYLLAQMSPGRARELVGIDQSRDAALGLFEPEGTDVQLVAIGRYCLADHGRSAEMAFVVREDRRGLGIATTLLGALIGIARERGLARLTAQVQRDNTGMLAIFRKAGGRISEIPGTSADEIILDTGSGPGFSDHK